MIEVYRFRTYDGQRDEWTQSRRWGTLAGIKKISGAPILSFKAIVDEQSIDPDGLTSIDFSPNPAIRLGEFQSQIS
ncbi:hypothetical protein M2305_002716 [Gluconobacter cerinus]|uniref:hypothetical protein n=1 Tax=Gluconobacter cerinus TaxID=38307 RepID=UPI0022273B28|nr:hypothetical protein [Gluconobacter cerinus]MCW2266769.1 hypothetical protein [Gluconobacter cerinus]